MIQRIKLIYVLLFFGVLGFVGLQTAFEWLPNGRPLYGDGPKRWQPKLSLDAWKEQSFQTQFTRWFDRNTGFRPHAVRAYNQLHFSLFHEITARTRKPVCAGRQDWLYSQDWISNRYRPVRRPEAKIKKCVADLKRLQTALHARGVGFVVVITPSKADIYPEYIPARYVRLGARSDLDYTRCIEQLALQEVAHVDAQRILLEHRAVQEYDTFPRSGIHWNDYGAWLGVSKTLELLHTQPLRNPLPEIVCEGVELRPPQGVETDLGKLICLWNYDSTQDPVPHPRLRSIPREDAPPTNLLLVGDSFAYQISCILESANYYQQRDTIFYFRTLTRYPSARNYAVEPGKIDWEDMLDRDAIIIEINKAYLPKFGYGFVDAALEYLDKHPPAM